MPATRAPTPEALRAFQRLAPADQVAQLRGTTGARACTILRDGLDQEARTAWLSIASEEPYERWWGVEILDHSKSSIRDARLKSGAPLLVGHDTRDQVGVIERFEITAGRKLRVLARFGRSARAQEIWQDVLDGIRRNTSVGYIIHDLVLEKSEGNINTYRVISWEPMEGSLVPVPADITVGVGRQLNSKGNHMEKEPEVISRSEQRRAPAETRQFATEVERIKALLAAGDAFADLGGVAIARELINDPYATADTFKARMADKLRGRSSPTHTAEPFRFPGDAYGSGAREILQQPKFFKGPGAQERAYTAGMWLKALFGKEDAKQWVRDRGMEIRAMSAAIGSEGGYLVPDELSATIIDLSESFGAFRMHGDVWPMKSDTLSVPKSTSDPDASFVGESGALPESDGDWGLVNLTAKKVGTIVRIPTELIDDAIINTADRVAFQLARAFAKKEDQCGFMGDGTSTYGGMTGIFNILVDGSHDAGKVLAATGVDTMAEITAADLALLVGSLPEYALEGAKFYCSNKVWGNVFLRLLLAAGGNSLSDISGAVPKSYGGYPVVTSSVLPAPAAVTTDFSSEVIIGFGNLRQSSKFGSRREIRIKILTERYADYDQIGVQATERFCVVNHDLGDNTTVGPFVGLVGN